MLLAAGVFWGGCGGEKGDVVRFLRGGVLIPSHWEQGREAGGGQRFWEIDWKPGEWQPVGKVEAEAPLHPSCAPLYSVELGDVSRRVALGGTAPDTALEFSGDGERLAVGTSLGELLVLNAWTGEVLARRKFPEAVVKVLVFSGDGETLYMAEQSPEALVHALDPTTLESRWTLALAERVGRSAAPAGEDLYGVYSLPSAYGMEELTGGDIVISAVHGWNDLDGVRRNLSQLLRVNPQGQVVQAWPSEPADVTLMHPQVDEAGGLVAVPVARSSAGPPPDLPIPGVVVLDLSDFTLRSSVVAAPLAPWFDSVFFWETIDLDVAADVLLLGLADGRVQIYTVEGQLKTELTLGVPVVTAGVPISASVGHSRLMGERVVTLTSGTNIPVAALSSAHRPPAAHPQENTLWIHDLEGSLVWTWRGPHVLEGLSFSPDNRWLVVGAGPRRVDHREDLFGALVFDAAKEDLSVFCPTESPVFFRHTSTRDGRVAVAESPYLREDGTLAGAYRVTVLR
jgi:WD40 repeat protein